MTDTGATEATTRGRRAGGAPLPAALGAVLCALAVVPAWWGTSADGPAVEPVWSVGPEWTVWQVDPWWSVAVLLGVAGCLAAAGGRRGRGRLFTSAALTVLVPQTLAVTATQGGVYPPGGATTSTFIWLSEADLDAVSGPAAELVAAAAVTALALLGLGVWRWRRRDGWGAVAAVVTLAVAAVTAGLTVARVEPSTRYPLMEGSVSEAYGSTISLSVGEYPSGSVPGRPGWAVVACAAVLVLHLVLLRRRPEDHAHADGALPWTGSARVRDLAALALVATGTALLLVGTTPWWIEWTSVPPDGVAWTAFQGARSPWGVVAVVVGLAGSVLGVRALRGGRPPSPAEPAPSTALRRGADRAVVTSWTAAALLGAHTAWGLDPTLEGWLPVAAAVLPAAQAVIVGAVTSGGGTRTA